MTLMDQLEARLEARLRVPRPSRAVGLLPIVALVLDAGIVVVASAIAAIGRDSWEIFTSGGAVHESIGLDGPIVVGIWLACIVLVGGYATSLFDAGTAEFARVGRGSLLAAGLVGVVAYLTKHDLSRGFFLLAFTLGIPALLLGRLMLRRTLHSARRRGSFRHTVLLVGTPGAIDDVARVLRREKQLGYRVAGALTPDGTLGDETHAGIPVVGRSTDVADTVRALGADVVFFADGAVTSTDEMRQIAWDLEHDDVQVIVAPSVSDVSGARVRIRPVGGLPLIHVDPPRVTDASRWGKRLFDVVGASAMLLALAPLFLFLALRIKLDDGGPVLFRQTRVGRNGDTFACLKFRTMVVDAEALLAQLHADTGYADGLFKMKDDPRVTRPGRLLRRFSLDELPQLLNVLRGEMSLVGPRPPLPLEVAQYSDRDARRLRVRPGLTGLWQVSGRSDLSWEEAIRLDLYYVDNWSALQDFSILTKTVRAVVRPSGAY